MKQSKLEDLFDYLPKSKIKAGDGLEEGKYPFYTSSENQSKYLNNFQHGPGCLVFGTGGKASVHLTTSHFATSTDCITIKPKPNVGIDAGYVFQYFKGNMQVLENGFKGAGLKHISKGYLSDIQIPHPEEITDQIRIAHLLGKVEGLIAQRKQHLQQLDDLLKSAFLEMFGDPVRNERGWEKKPFSALLLDIESGKSPKCESRPATTDEWGVLKLGAVTSCFYKEGENKAFPENERPSIRDEVKAGDLLFSRKNTYELVAACVYVFSTRSKLLMPDLIFRFVFRDDAEVNPIYVWKLLTAQSQRKAIQSLASGAAGSMPNISKANLREILLPIPPLALQNDFAAIVEKVEGLKSSYQQSLTDLKALYGTLSQQAFKGELDLSRIPLDKQTHKDKGKKTIRINGVSILPGHVQTTLANLNTFNQTAASHFKALEEANRLSKLPWDQLNSVSRLAEQFASFRSPLQELGQMSALSKACEQAQAALKPLNLDRLESLTKTAALARSLALEVPKIDLGRLSLHDEFVKKAYEPLESLRRTIEQFQIPSASQHFSDLLSEQLETAKRFQSTIPDFTTWQKLASEMSEIDFDESDKQFPWYFKPEDVAGIISSANEPLSFESLLQQLGELNAVDFAGYERIKTIIFDLLATNQLKQVFDENQKTLFLSAVVTVPSQ